MTDLVMRTFRVEPGCHATVVHLLGSLAAATIRQVAGTSVCIFRVDNDPQQILWIGDCGRESDFAWLTSILPTVPPAVLEYLLSHLAAPATELTLRREEEYCRGLTTPYQIWSVELPAPDTCGVDLVRELHALRVDRRLVGSVLYRSTAAPRIAVVFLGLACGVTPSTMGFSAARPERARICGTLSLLLDLCRLACDLPASAPERRASVPEFLRHGAANGASGKERALGTPGDRTSW